MPSPVAHRQSASASHSAIALTLSNGATYEPDAATPQPSRSLGVARNGAGDGSIRFARQRAVVLFPEPCKPSNARIGWGTLSRFATSHAKTSGRDRAAMFVTAHNGPKSSPIPGAGFGSGDVSAVCRNSTGDLAVTCHPSDATTITSPAALARSTTMSSLDQPTRRNTLRGAW